ncbi:FMN-binding protein [Methylobacillus sp. MM3]|jgi:Na+-translocating ferredoxin:NAD+ oxidoreductase RnfG subunit|uniref:FMN-binding protein n=1 Tax=Methylobacillus sp. MM3 TaxID=1848039 RepID=UPI0007E17C17|nr:FMN-binding protein [Methylobacillus sp. MM3]OAJ70887.1 FMN-binding protein [Methylobacillus sp. MM3]
MKQSDWNALLLLPVAAITAPAYAIDYFTAEQAQKQIFPDAQVFKPMLVKLSSAQRDQIKSLAGVRQRWEEQKVWRVEKDGKLAGWFVVDDVVGKHEFITYGVGITPDGHVVGVEVMSYRETKGDQVRDAGWRKHFVGKTLADPFKLDEDVPNISGATLSSRNMLDGVKRLLALQKVALTGE